VTLVIVVSAARLEVALMADVVAVVILSVWSGHRRRHPGGGLIWMALASRYPAVTRTWTAIVLNFKRALLGGAVLWVLLLFLDRRAAEVVVVALLPVFFVVLFVAMLWGGILAVVVSVPTLIVGMTYKKARRVTDEYRRLTEGDLGGRGPRTGRPSTGSEQRPRYATPFATEYGILGLQGHEPPDAVRQKWRELAVRLHPDGRASDSHAGRESAQERLKYVNAAYTVLKKNGRAA